MALARGWTVVIKYRTPQGWLEGKIKSPSLWINSNWSQPLHLCLNPRIVAGLHLDIKHVRPIGWVGKQSNTYTNHGYEMQRLQFRVLHEDLKAEHATAWFVYVRRVWPGREGAVEKECGSWEDLISWVLANSVCFECKAPPPIQGKTNKFRQETDRERKREKTHIEELKRPQTG